MPFDKAKYWKEYKAKNAGRWSLKRSPLKPSKVKIKPVSKKLQKMKTVYGHLRKDYLETQPFCEARLPECTIQATEIHHKGGRIGLDLINIGNFLAVCRSCHNWIEANGSKAKELGLSVSRLAG